MDPEEQAAVNFYRARLEDQLRSLRDSLDQWRNYKKEYAALQEKISDLPKKTTRDIRVPFGKFASIPGTLIHTNEITVLLGENWFVERSAHEAAEIIGRRIEYVEETVKKVEGEMEGVRERLGAFQELERQTVGDVNEVGEPIVEITEELDDEGNVVKASTSGKGRGEVGKLLDLTGGENDKAQSYEDLDELMAELEREEEEEETLRQNTATNGAITLEREETKSKPDPVPKAAVMTTHATLSKTTTPVSPIQSKEASSVSMDSPSVSHSEDATGDSDDDDGGDWDVSRPSDLQQMNDLMSQIYGDDEQEWDEDAEERSSDDDLEEDEYGRVRGLMRNIIPPGQPGALGVVHTGRIERIGAILPDPEARVGVVEEPMAAVENDAKKETENESKEKKKVKFAKKLDIQTKKSPKQKPTHTEKEPAKGVLKKSSPPPEVVKTVADTVVERAPPTMAESVVERMLTEPKAPEVGRIKVSRFKKERSAGPPAVMETVVESPQSAPSQPKIQLLPPTTPQPKAVANEVVECPIMSQVTERTPPPPAAAPTAPAAPSAVKQRIAAAKVQKALETTAAWNGSHKSEHKKAQEAADAEAKEKATAEKEVAKKQKEDEAWEVVAKPKKVSKFKQQQLKEQEEKEGEEKTGSNGTEVEVTNGHGATDGDVADSTESTPMTNGDSNGEATEEDPKLKDDDKPSNPVKGAVMEREPPPPEPLDSDEDLSLEPTIHYKEIAAQYHKLRERRIQREGGYVKPEEDDAVTHWDLEEEAESAVEYDGTPKKKVSRFKAARMGRKVDLEKLEGEIEFK
ncbi:hypothetical protein SAICODRAFT_9203 [Saitoella complicata NRRL Y-17804]|nr:uncharacterized protein SAICODRAFT_9203 [Saitoella complicata NRRL Y-17804]ODQ51206.1 hypothetical protein SAICODRAFT_9203 [Saitoella complicata NRRL Y-17804]